MNKSSQAVPHVSKQERLTSLPFIMVALEIKSMLGGNIAKTIADADGIQRSLLLRHQGGPAILHKSMFTVMLPPNPVAGI